LTAIIIADVWEWFPFVMLMVLASLQMMPQEYVEAARVDGASVWQMTWYVTLPHLKGVLLVAALFRLVDSIKAFPLIYILTDGGPGNGDRGHQLLLVPAGLQLLLSRLFERHHRGALVAMTVLLSWAIIRLVGWGQRVD
jgi:multiple sugar transport system permease protein